MVVVTGTGMDTEIGKIASLMNATKEKKTPLQVSLDQFSGRLAAVIMVICAIVFALSLYRKMPILDSLMFAVALAVASVWWLNEMDPDERANRPWIGIVVLPVMLAGTLVPMLSLIAALL